MSISDEFDLDNSEEIKDVSLDLNLVKTNIPQYSSEKLCDMVVCDRYFGFNQKIAIMCMEELAQRRVSGDKFLFEDYIEKAFNELPKLDFVAPDLRTILNQAIKQQKNK